MAHACLVLEDTPDGQIAARATYTGGFDRQSHAHQHLQIVIKMLDQLLEPKGELPPELAHLADGPRAVATPDHVGRSAVAQAVAALTQEG